MNWPDLLWTMWLEIVTGSTAAGWIVALGLTIAAGVALGHIKVFGVSLGVTTVIFAAIAYSWVFWSSTGMTYKALMDTKTQIEVAKLQSLPSAQPLKIVDGAGVADSAIDESAIRAKIEKSYDEKIHVRKEVLEFIREFGLVLFVYCIGMMVGPGFIHSLKNQGVRWNIMAACVVFLGLGVTALVVVIAGQHPAAAVGVMSGAITNTPGWAAAQATLKELKTPAEQIGMTVSGYAVAYPFGIAGIIGSLMTIKLLFGIRPKEEVEAFAQANKSSTGTLNVNLKVMNPGIVGKSVSHVDALAGEGVVVSRVQRGDQQLVPKPEFCLALGDLLHAVGGKEGVTRLQEIVGERIEDDIRETQILQHLLCREVLVTNEHVIGDGIAKLDFPRSCGATVTRIKRHGKEMIADDAATLHYADRLVVVGDDMGIKRVEDLVGNAPGHLDHPQLIGLFLGIAVGIVLGQIPIPIPGLSQPVKLGLAGGPIVAALFFSSMGHLGKHIIFHVNKGANNLMREFGIALFLACVGLLSANSFVSYAFSMQGLIWIVCALCISMIPLLIVGVVARVFFKENYTALMGLLAGSCTDPPALAFANGTAGNELPGLAYATVYPLTMLLRVVGAQIFVLLWMAT